MGFLFKLQPLTQILYCFKADTLYLLQVIAAAKGRPAVVASADTLTVRNYCLRSTGTYLRQPRQRSRRCDIRVYSAFQLNRLRSQARGLFGLQPARKTTRKYNRDENSNHKRKKLNPASLCAAVLDNFIGSHLVRQLIELKIKNQITV
jgi:hypothetical protein